MITGLFEAHINVSNDVELEIMPWTEWEGLHGRELPASSSCTELT
ncbi:hypothetical protein [Paenibacillus typhae]